MIELNGCSVITFVLLCLEVSIDSIVSIASAEKEW